MLPPKTPDPRTLPPGEYTLAENLRLFVQPAGSRTWRVAYRLHGKRRQIMIGTLKELDLDAAKSVAQEIRPGNRARIVQQRKLARTKATLLPARRFAHRKPGSGGMPRRGRLPQTELPPLADRHPPAIGDRSVADIEIVEMLPPGEQACVSAATQMCAGWD
jgi:hypothetical protein